MLGGFHQGSPSGVLNWGRKKALVSPGEGEWRSKRDTGQFFPPITYPTHGKKLAQRGDCRSEGVGCHPARRSADVCQRGAVRQRMGGGNTPGGVSPHPQGARLALRLVCQGDVLHYPVGQPVFGDSLPFLLAQQQCHKAKCTAHSSRQLMCQSSWGPVQSPEPACPLHVAPQPVLEASVVTTVCRDTCSRGTQARTGCCTAENCWAKPLTVSLNSPAWEMGMSRKCALSTSLISTRLSQRWRSWTTMVDIAFPRDRAVTFVARRAKSVAVRSSCINPGSVLPSCTCLSALAW